MSFDLESVQKRDIEVLAWARGVESSLILRAPSSGRARKGKGREKGLAQSIFNRNNKKDGSLYAVGFQFKRAGVFAEMGVFGGLTRAKAIAQGKLNPKPWFNPVMRQHVPKLLNILEDNTQRRVYAVLQRLEIKNT
jgi:hypothetical protein